MTTDSYSCYAASNSIFMNASDQDQLLEVYLQECYCLSLLTYCHGALSLSKAQLSDLNVRWNNLDRKLFHFHQWESVRVFINGIGKLHFLHLSKLIAAKFFKHLSMSSNVGLRQVFDKLYSPQMVVTANTTKYTIENDLTKKRKKRRKNKQTHSQNGMYLS